MKNSSNKFSNILRQSAIFLFFILLILLIYAPVFQGYYYQGEDYSAIWTSKWAAHSDKSFLSFELQEAIVDVLNSKVTITLEKFMPKSFFLGGGVAANKRLREVLKNACEAYGVEVFVPDIKYCMDNAAMVGSAALFQPRSLKVEDVRADPALEVVS